MEKSVFQASAKNDVLKVCRKEYEVCFYVSLKQINHFIRPVKIFYRKGKVQSFYSYISKSARFYMNENYLSTVFIKV